MNPNFSIFSCFLASKYLKQGRFSGPIPGNQSNLIAFSKVKGNVLKQGLNAVGFCQALDGNVVHDAKVRSTSTKYRVPRIDIRETTNEKRENVFVSRLSFLVSRLTPHASRLRRMIPLHDFLL